MRRHHHTTPTSTAAGAIAMQRQFRTQPFSKKPETADELLETGLPNLWYLVARSSDVADRPVGIKRLSRNLVLWRDSIGSLNVVEDYCPHRGAPLSLGQIVGDNVMCPYHGIQINGRGAIADVPSTPECPLLGKAFTKSYAHREVGGAIFVYFGDAANAPEPIFPEEVTSPEWTSFLFITVWNCNWQVALDNRLDPIHGSFLHEGTFTLAAGRKDSELKVDETPNGFQTYRTNQKNVNIDWNEVRYHPDNIFWVTTEIPYPASFGGGSFRINGHPTPIDKDSTLVWFFRSRKISGWEREMWRFLYKNRLESRAYTVVDQDRILLEAIPLEARQRERMIQTDIAVARMRRRIRAEAVRNLEALSRT
jgi:phenylpropionate dioxygenase-like ring-hydroxylating dioxygenase large terminal subunit